MTKRGREKLRIIKKKYRCWNRIWIRL